MGLFSNFCKVYDKIKDVGRVVTEKVKDFLGFGVDKTAKDTGEQRAYDEAATLAETKRMNQILSDFSLKLSNYADDLEENALNESSIYFKILLEKVDSNENKVFKINTAKIKRNQLKIERQIMGSFKKHLSKRVSLDDSECLSILKLDAGENKRVRMQNFGNKVLREASNNLCNSIKESLLDQQEYIEECLNDKVEERMKLQQEMIEKCTQLEQAYKQGEFEIETQRVEVISKIALCEIALDILE